MNKMRMKERRLEIKLHIESASGERSEVGEEAEVEGISG